MNENIWMNLSVVISDDQTKDWRPAKVVIGNLLESGLEKSFLAELHPYQLTSQLLHQLSRQSCETEDRYEFIAPKPAGYDYLSGEEKYTMTNTVVRNLEEYIGPVEASRCWWKFVRGTSETEWLSWYMLEDHRPQKSRRRMFGAIRQD